MCEPQICECLHKAVAWEGMNGENGSNAKTVDLLNQSLVHTSNEVFQ